MQDRRAREGILIPRSSEVPATARVEPVGLGR